MKNVHAGSGKKYEKCCKNKNMKYLKTNDENGYIKSIPLKEEMKEIFDEIRKDYKNWFGRDLKSDEYMMPNLLRQDFKYLERTLKLKFPEEIEKIYAYSKTGILLTEYNINQFADVEIKEYKDAVKEYRKLMKSKISKNTANRMQVIEFINYEMQSICNTELEPIQFCLRLLMKQLSEKIAENKMLVIENRDDFFAYCLYKLNRNIMAMEGLIENGYFESIMAIVRFVYEILINILTYSKNDKLFNDKIMTIAGLEEGLYYKKSKNIVVDKITGKEYNTRITTKELAEQSGENYKKMYDSLYTETSNFIHVDVLAANKIFNDNDLFLELDENYVAALIVITLNIIAISNFIKYDKIDESLEKDILYYTNKTAKRISKILENIKIVDDREIYDLLINCLDIKNRDYKVNYERLKNVEIV